jgi:hypothetical protein
MRTVTAAGARHRLALATLIALLLPAGVLAAASVDPDRAGGDRQVRTAGFSQEGLVAGPLASQASETSGVTTTPPSPTTTTPRTLSSVAAVPRSTTPTTVRPGAASGSAVTSTTTATLLPGLPLPGLPPLATAMVARKRSSRRSGQPPAPDVP